MTEGEKRELGICPFHGTYHFWIGCDYVSVEEAWKAWDKINR